MLGLIRASQTQFVWMRQGSVNCKDNCQMDAQVYLTGVASVSIPFNGEKAKCFQVTFEKPTLCSRFVLCMRVYIYRNYSLCWIEILETKHSLSLNRHSRDGRCTREILSRGLIMSITAVTVCVKRVLCITSQKYFISALAALMTFGSKLKHQYETPI